MVFISLPDFHWALDDFGYNSYRKKKLTKLLLKFMKLFLNNSIKMILIISLFFSDHGFKFNFERKLENKRLMLNTDRTNTVLIHRSKNQDEIITDQRLCSLSDFMSTYKHILNRKSSYDYSFLGHKHRDL